MDVQFLDKYVSRIQALFPDSRVEWVVRVSNQGWLPFTYLYKGKQEDGVLGYFGVKINGDLASHWYLYAFPHCCGICVSAGTMVERKFRNQGLGKLLNSVRQDIAREMGYTTLMCTDIEANTPQRKLLASQGWTDIYTFVNKRTNNTVKVSVINL